MQQKLTISIDKNVYDALHAVVGRGHISRFLEDLARPHLEVGKRGGAKRGAALVRRMKGKGDVHLSTDEIMALTRGE